MRSVPHKSFEYIGLIKDFNKVNKTLILLKLFRFVSFHPFIALPYRVNVLFNLSMVIFKKLVEINIGVLTT